MKLSELADRSIVPSKTSLATLKLLVEYLELKQERANRINVLRINGDAEIGDHTTGYARLR